MFVPQVKPEWGKRGVRTKRYTFVMNKREGKEVEYVLYDNVEDKYQLKNIAKERPEVVKELKAELEMLLIKNKDPWQKN